MPDYAADLRAATGLAVNNWVEALLEADQIPLNQQINSLQEQLTGKQALLDEAKMQLMDLQASFTASQGSLSRAEARIVELQVEIADLKANANVNERDLVTRGQYDPGPTTTGPTHPSKITKVTGIQTFDVSGMTGPVVITDKHYVNTIRFIGSSQHQLSFVNCKANGVDDVGGSVATAIVGHGAGDRNIVWIDSEVNIGHRAPGDPANVHHMKFIRCNVWGGIDGIGIWNAHDGNNAVDILDSWIHDQLFLSPFSRQSDNKSHSDGIHGRGGENVNIKGNNLQAYYTQGKGNASEPPRVDSAGKHLGGNPFFPSLVSACAIQISHDYGAPRNWIIEQNLFEGGTVGINAATYGGGDIGSISYNRVGVGTFRNGPDHFVIRSTGVTRPANTFKFEGNVNAYTGAPFNIIKRGDY